MDKETKDIVKLIAGIQIESLNSIKEDVKNGNDIPVCRRRRGSRCP